MAAARGVLLVAEAGEALALGAALGFALLLAHPLALTTFLVLVVAGDDADALAQRAVLRVRCELLAARAIVATGASAAVAAGARAAGTAFHRPRRASSAALLLGADAEAGT